MLEPWTEISERLRRNHLNFKLTLYLPVWKVYLRYGAPFRA
jgi:hypothetical protein